MPNPPDARPVPGGLPYTTPGRLLRDFASRGLVALAPEDLGIPLDIHDLIYEKERTAFNAGRYITASLIPEILEVVESPGVVAACDALLGRNWAIVPFTHNTPFPSGARDQHWHKDDNGPYNLRKHRHHQAVQVEMLYYPQEVRHDNGPTAVVPYSQYWTFNHEENHDNFAGADHLDFGYQVSGMERTPISGPDSTYPLDDIVNRRTPHDARMRQAIPNTGWPLVAQFEAAPLKAGSVILYSHNLFHRGNHRRDDWHTWKERPRFMWRFWLYRTTDPDGETPDEIDWPALGVDEMTDVDLARAPDDATVVWHYHHHWLHTGRPPARREADGHDASAFAEQLYAKGEAAEPARIGAAYKLASHGDTKFALVVQPLCLDCCKLRSSLCTDKEVRMSAKKCTPQSKTVDLLGPLGEALHCERESVRRAATYGLVALGSDATDVFLDATRSPVKWIRKAGVYGLGDVAPLDERVLDAVADRLANDPSVYVRSVAANALGCLGRRAVATGTGRSLVPRCASALVESLGREENRLGMNIAQDRSIKFVRPTDECDVCEGIGINYSTERFKRVRSAVRENALTSMVVLCSHGAALLREELEPTVAALADVVRTDENVFSVGLALDSLNRLANGGAGHGASIRKTLFGLLKEMPIHSWEPLVRSGLDPSRVHEFGQSEIERP